MKKLAQRYGVQELSQGRNKPPLKSEDANLDTILVNQEKYIEELRSVIDVRKSELHDMKQSTALLESRLGSKNNNNNA